MFQVISSSCQAAAVCASTTYQALGRVLSSVTYALFKRGIEPIAGYFLRICVFRDSALQGRVSQWIVLPFVRAAGGIWLRIQGISTPFTRIEPTRLNSSAQFLAEFAEIRTITTADGVRLPFTIYTPERFEQWVAAHGGVRDGEWIRPRRPQDWAELQHLRNFKWFVEEGQAFRVPPLQPGASERCLLRVQGFGRTMPMDKAYIGMHLAAGFNYALFDWRGGLTASACFQDADAAYQAVRQAGFAADRITAMGSCRATFVVAHLKEQHGHEGLNVAMIQAPPSLHAAIAHTPWPARSIGMLGLGAIEDAPHHFDTLRRLQALPHAAGGATCLVMSEGDQTLPENAVQELRAAAERSGPCEVIMEPRVAGVVDPHFGDPLHNPTVLARYLAFLRH